jgi:hypothetical protein
MVWRLLQVRKLHGTPLILIGRMWAEFLRWGRQYLLTPELNLASPEDLNIPHCVDMAAEAIALIRPRHEEWLSEPGETGR